VPRAFFGVSPQDGLTARDFERMSGVIGTIRIPVYWMHCEPRPGDFEFDALDQVVGMAADAGIRVLPFVYGSPAWVAAEPARPPLAKDDRAVWARFLRVLVDRYGPGGEFWNGRAARLPIRRWQLWNEPNFPIFWAPRPSPAGYARLLATGARAIRGADPQARIVLAGLAPIERHPLPWDFLRRLYAVPGFARSFDVVALHPYSASLRSLSYQVAQTRAAMAAAGDAAKPLEITEFGVASGGVRASPMVKTPAGQAAFLRRAFGLLLANRRTWRLSGAEWFTWRDGITDDPHCVFCEHAGLFDAGDRPKPAWWALRGLAGRAATPSARTG
jgi:polysaccharide biosynthesis protein PslG